MSCMTTKQKFDVENPPVVMLANGRYAYKCECPWVGKNGKVLTAFKFCSAKAYEDYNKQMEQTEAPEEPELEAIPERPESPA